MTQVLLVILVQLVKVFNIKAQLTLFIDESGYVQRVRVDGPALPPLLEEAAVNVFRQARFSPGQVGTQVVRSMIRIEVNFESQRFNLNTEG